MKFLVQIFPYVSTETTCSLVSIHRITEHLGSGQFGTVNKGLWQSPAGAMEVAVKTLKAGSPEEDKVKFLQEAAINGQFRHPNIVQLMGVVTVGEPVNPATHCIVLTRVLICNSYNNRL